MTVKLLQCLIVQSGVIGLIIGFTHIVLVKYVTNTHIFKQGILKLLSEFSMGIICNRLSHAYAPLTKCKHLLFYAEKTAL